MKTRTESFFTLAAFVAVLSVVNAAGAQQSGTADEAKALLVRAAAAVQADKAGALALLASTAAAALASSALASSAVPDC